MMHAAGLGVIASGYAAFAVSRSAVNQDRKNADRFLAAWCTLEERKLDLSACRERTALGDSKAVRQFFEPLKRPLSEARRHLEEITGLP